MKIIKHERKREWAEGPLAHKVLEADPFGDLHPQTEPSHVKPKAGDDSVYLLDPNFRDQILKSTSAQDKVDDQG